MPLLIMELTHLLYFARGVFDVPPGDLVDKIEKWRR